MWFVQSTYWGCVFNPLSSHYNVKIKICCNHLFHECRLITSAVSIKVFFSPDSAKDASQLQGQCNIWGMSGWNLGAHALILEFSSYMQTDVLFTTAKLYIVINSSSCKRNSIGLRLPEINTLNWQTFLTFRDWGEKGLEEFRCSETSCPWWEMPLAWTHSSW